MPIFTRFYDWFTEMTAPAFWLVYAVPLIVLLFLIGSYEVPPVIFSSSLNYDVVGFVERYALALWIGFLALWAQPLFKDPFGSQRFAFPIWLFGILLWIPLIAYMP